MRWATTILAVCAVFFGAMAANAQGKQPAKEEPTKEEPKKEEPKKEEWLDDEGMKKLMETLKDNWNKLKLNTRSKMGDKAAEAGDALAADADKMLKYHKKDVREAKDWQDWVAALKKQAQDFSKAAKKSDWKEAEKQRDKLAESCGDKGCHGKYRPDEEK